MAKWRIDPGPLERNRLGPRNIEGIVSRHQLPVIAPVAAGSKSTAIVQYAPRAIVNAVVELEVVCVQVELGSHAKIVETLGLVPVVGSGNPRLSVLP